MRASRSPSCCSASQVIAAQAGVFALQHRKPDGRVRFHDLGSRLLGKRQGPIGVSLPDRYVPATRCQPLAPELANRLEHGVAWLDTKIPLVADEALGNKRVEEIQSRGCWGDGVMG